ncbi:MAG: nuclear transport factor 2 family protein [Alphaproteobacteria bacterium]|nr:nuclear transport factor 2 family protein [Alphaproteobacteria bacterium]
MDSKANTLTEKQKAALLFANEAFYIAFATGDISAMEELWARNFKVSCLHPGWEPLLGRNNVMASWNAVLPNKPSISHHAPNAFGVGDMGYVICYEKIGDSYLLATNVFVLENNRWRMTHHQAGPTDSHPVEHEEKGGLTN